MVGTRSHYICVPELPLRYRQIFRLPRETRHGNRTGANTSMYVGRSARVHLNTYCQHMHVIKYADTA